MITCVGWVTQDVMNLCEGGGGGGGGGYGKYHIITLFACVFLVGGKEEVGVEESCCGTY